MSILMGSAGGAAGTEDGDYGGFGGSGGGAISLVANTMDIAGTITANGGDGQIYINDASGGGAGGAILLHAGSVTGSGTLRADGGNGGTSCGLSPCILDDGGGGGGGGRIKIFYSSGTISPTVSVAGGAGSLNGKDGEEGSYHAEIEATIEIKPETLNLKSKGVFTAFIDLPEGFDEEDIDISTVVCEGAPAVSGVMADDGRLIVKFDREDLVGVSVGDDVELVVTGLVDGKHFAGSDAIRVMDKGKK